MAMKKRVDAHLKDYNLDMEAKIKKTKEQEDRQKKKEASIAEIYRMFGRIETSKMYGEISEVANLAWLKKIKEGKLYRDIDGMNSWESFCSRLGLSRRKIDEDLLNFDKFGDPLFQSLSQLSLGRKDIRKLRNAIPEGDMTIEGEFVVIGEEKIPLTPDSKDDLEAAFEALIEERDRKIKESQVIIRVKDRRLAEKERVIRNQEKDLFEFTKEIKNRDYEPGEKEFIQQMEIEKNVITGVLLKLDPEKIEDKTPLMTAKYIEVLAFFKRMSRAYYDTAIETRAQPDDIKWRQPGLKEMEQEEPINIDIMKVVGE